MIDAIKEAILEAQAEIMEVYTEIQKEAAEGQIMRDASRIWRAVPEQIKEQFKQQQPDQYRELLRGINRKRKAVKNGSNK